MAGVIFAVRVAMLIVHPNARVHIYDADLIDMSWMLGKALQNLLLEVLSMHMGSSFFRGAGYGTVHGELSGRSASPQGASSDERWTRPQTGRIVRPEL
jgi:hypothetical protein